MRQKSEARSQKTEDRKQGTGDRCQRTAGKNSQLATRNSKLQCARCGSCAVVCPVFRVNGRETLTARGKMHLLSTPFADSPSAHFQDLFACCLLCGACETVCPRELPITEMVANARSRFSLFYGRHGIRKMFARTALSSPKLLESLVRAGITIQRMEALPKDSGLRLKLGLLEPQSSEEHRAEPCTREQTGLSSGAQVTYFTGCLARYLQPSVAEATEQLVRQRTDRGSYRPDDQGCCGLAAWSGGKIDEARRLAKKNITAFSASKGPILTSCGSCSAHLSKYPQLFINDKKWREQALAFSARVREFSSFFSSLLANVKFIQGEAQRVFYHDPCHLRFTREGREAPRRLLDMIGNVNRMEAEDGHFCCGQGGLFHLGYPELSEQIFQRAFDAVICNRPDCIVTTCSGCLMQWQQGVAAKKAPVQVRHLAVYLAGCLADSRE